MSSGKSKIIDSGLNVPVPASPLARAAVLPARRDDAKIFLREFTRELIRELSLTTRILSLFTAAILVGGLLFVGNKLLTRYRAQDRNVGQTENLKQRLDEQERRLAQLDEQHKQTSSDPSSDPKYAETPVTNNVPLPTRLWNEYGRGTCLIAGSYVLIDVVSGRPLRHPEAGASADEESGEGRSPLTPEGNGAIFEMAYVGTGFHVGGGYVLTNRHIARGPWTVDRRTQFLISSTNSKPRLEKLLAFFPGERKPIPLQFRTASEKEDVAVCALKSIPSNIPVLPLDHQSGATEIGKAIVMMGYPTGPNRLLALLPEAEAVSIESEYGGSLETLLDQLAKRKLIKPLTTQGHITDLYKNRIIFDAATTEGSSGTPMFGESGKVIGITFAVFVDEHAASFAVPIATGLEVLKKAGWKPDRDD